MRGYKPHALLYTLKLDTRVIEDGLSPPSRRTAARPLRPSMAALRAVSLCGAQRVQRLVLCGGSVALTAQCDWD
ncbi:hypothetical protein MHYP_G00129640 [Metynnis hypsauchen]